MFFAKSMPKMDMCHSSGLSLPSLITYSATKAPATLGASGGAGGGAGGGRGGEGQAACVLHRVVPLSLRGARHWRCVAGCGSYGGRAYVNEAAESHHEDGQAKDEANDAVHDEGGSD